MEPLPENKEKDRINKIELVYHRAKVKSKPDEERLTLDRETETIFYEQHREKNMAAGYRYLIGKDLAEYLDSLDADTFFRDEDRQSAEENPYRDLAGTCAVTVSYQQQPAMTLACSYDRDGLPKEYESFLESVRYMIHRYDYSDLFAPVLYRKVFPKKGELIFCSILFQGSDKSYYYLTDDVTMDVGDEVEVPVGPSNNRKVGTIADIACYRPEDAPFPVEQVKQIAGKTLIKKAIERFYADQTTDNLMRIMAVLEDSMIWIPCTVRMGESDQKQLEEMLEGAGEDADALKGEIFTSNEEIHLVPDILQNGREYFFPVFSSKAEMGDYGTGMSSIQETFVKAISLARNNTKYEIAGIVVNAYSRSFVLKWDLLDLIEKDAEQMIPQKGSGN